MVELYRLAGSLASLSMTGSFLVILTYLMLKELRHHPTNLVFYLSVSDFFFSLKFFITSIIPQSANLQTHTNFCIAQAVFTQFFGLASISWNGIISLNLLFNLRNPFANTASYGKFYHLFVWSLCLSTTFAMVITESYGPSGDGTCWVRSDADAFRLTFFIPLIIYFITSIASLIVAALRTKSITTEQEQHQETRGDADVVRQRIMFRIRLYVAVFILFWSGPLAHRIVQALEQNKISPHGFPSSDNKALQYLDVIGVSLQGFANACLWLTNPSFFKSFRTQILPKLHIPMDGEKLPLIPNALGQHLKDSNQDIQRIDIILRKYVISCIVEGIKQSVSGIIQSKEYMLSLKAADFSEHRSLDPKLFWEDDNEQGHSPSSSRLKYTFVDYAPVVFLKLRQLCGITPEGYLESLEPSLFIANLDNQKFSDGRSGSFFVFSPDKQFIIKTIPESEAILLQEILPRFYDYLSSNPNSLIIKFYGLHAIGTPHGELIHVAVMENVFNTPKRIHEKYDLKGSWIHRKVGKSHDLNPSVLGMDLDLKKKLNLPQNIKEKLIQQIASDAKFFASLNIMDYSLLLGFHFVDKESKIAIPDASDNEMDTSEEMSDPESEEDLFSSNKMKPTLFRQNYGGILSVDGTELYFMGIIDILQLYDAQKKRERFFKVYMLHKDKEGISVQEPKTYSERFIKGIEKIMK